MIGFEWLGFTKLAEQLGELLKKLRSEKDRRNNEASAYFHQPSNPNASSVWQSLKGSPDIVEH